MLPGTIIIKIMCVEVGRSFKRSGTGVIHVGVEVRAGDAEVDVIYISFIMSVQYIGY